MKKFFIILVITFLATTSNAQFFLGGDLGVSLRSEKVKRNTNITNSTQFGFAVAPKAGYYFNNKFAVGLGFNISPSFQTYKPNQNDREWNTVLAWSVDPFVRYHVFTVKKFFIILEGTVSVGGTHHLKTFGQQERRPTTINIGVIRVAPILGYKLTDRIQLEAGLNFLSLGYGIDITTGENETRTTHQFIFGATSANILNVGSLRIGAIFKF